MLKISLFVFVLSPSTRPSLLPATRWSLGVLGFELLTGSTPFAVAPASGGGREKRTGTELRILKEDPAIPKGVSAEVESLLRGLLVKDPLQRLGSRGGAAQIKNHPAFQGFDWEACNARRLRPPIQPQLASELDLSLFSDEFTQLPIAESPAIVPQNEGLFKVSLEDRHLLHQAQRLRSLVRINV